MSTYHKVFVHAVHNGEWKSRIYICCVHSKFFAETKIIFMWYQWWCVYVDVQKYWILGLFLHWQKSIKWNQQGHDSKSIHSMPLNIHYMSLKMSFIIRNFTRGHNCHTNHYHMHLTCYYVSCSLRSSWPFSHRK
jgi:hypothetical protein